jgi:hypothetical protein
MGLMFWPEEKGMMRGWVFLTIWESEGSLLNISLICEENSFMTLLSPVISS